MYEKHKKAGEDLAKQQAAPLINPQPKRMKQSSNKQCGQGCLWGLLFLVCIFFLIAAFMAVSNSNSTTQQSELASCLSNAQATYSQNWENECIAEGGAGNDGLNCKINIAQATLLDERLQGAKDDCYHMYPQQ